MQNKFAPGWDTSDLTYFPGAIKFTDIEQFVQEEIHTAVQQAVAQAKREVASEVISMLEHRIFGSQFNKTKERDGTYWDGYYSACIDESYEIIEVLKAKYLPKEPESEKK